MIFIHIWLETRSLFTYLYFKPKASRNNNNIHTFNAQSKLTKLTRTLNKHERKVSMSRDPRNEICTRITRTKNSHFQLRFTTLESQQGDGKRKLFNDMHQRVLAGRRTLFEFWGVQGTWVVECTQYVTQRNSRTCYNFTTTQHQLHFKSFEQTKSQRLECW